MMTMKDPHMRMPGSDEQRDGVVSSSPFLMVASSASPRTSPRLSSQPRSSLRRQPTSTTSTV
eukprot:304291-Rhodomonas_salina.1